MKKTLPDLSRISRPLLPHSPPKPCSVARMDPCLRDHSNNLHFIHTHEEGFPRDYYSKFSHHYYASTFPSFFCLPRKKSIFAFFLSFPLHFCSGENIFGILSHFRDEKNALWRKIDFSSFICGRTLRSLLSPPPPSSTQLNLELGFSSSSSSSSPLVWRGALRPLRTHKTEGRGQFHEV